MFAQLLNQNMQIRLCNSTNQTVGVAIEDGLAWRFSDSQSKLFHVCDRIGIDNSHIADCCGWSL